jgi:hypothetical protein
MIAIQTPSFIRAAFKPESPNGAPFSGIMGEWDPVCKSTVFINHGVTEDRLQRLNVKVTQ